MLEFLEVSLTEFILVASNCTVNSTKANAARTIVLLFVSFLCICSFFFLDLTDKLRFTIGREEFIEGRGRIGVRCKSKQIFIHIIFLIAIDHDCSLRVHCFDVTFGILGLRL